MEDIDCISIASSDQDITEIQDKTANSDKNSNTFRSEMQKNIYDLTEFEEEAIESKNTNETKIRIRNTKVILKELSIKYSDNFKSKHSEYKKESAEVILLTDSSDVESVSEVIAENNNKKQWNNINTPKKYTPDCIVNKNADIVCRRTFENVSSSSDEEEDGNDITLKYETENKILVTELKNDIYTNISSNTFADAMEMENNDLEIENNESNKASTKNYKNASISSNKKTRKKRKSDSAFKKVDTDDVYNDDLLEDLNCKRSLADSVSKKKCNKMSPESSENLNKNFLKQTENRKLEIERKRTMKNIEKMKKKVHAEKEKALKQAQKLVNKCIKREECLKYMTVNVDAKIFENKIYGQYIMDNLATDGVKTKLTTNFPGVISWTRKIISIENMTTKETVATEQQFAVIITSKEFKNLTSYIKNIKQITEFKHLSVFVFGQSKPTSAQEDEIMDVEMIFDTYWQFVSTKEELCSFLLMLTKAIAQIPYRLQQEEKFKNREYFEDCNKKTVKVDKNGNGLGRLWRQMLTMFPLVRLETAEAITTVYPTPLSLFQGYSTCTESTEHLLQELPIRRAQGPLVAVRKLGPELSKKCSRFFTSEENILI